MAAEHSPLPWRVVKSRGLNSYELRSAGGAYLADLWGVDMPVPNGVKVGEVKANAAFIVRAVNSHAALVEALTEMVACCTNEDGAVSPEPDNRGRWLRAMIAAREALALADGREEPAR